MVIRGYGYVGSLGVAGSARDFSASETAHADPLNLTWSAISSDPFPRFGRLDPLCKCACAAVELTGMAAGGGEPRDEMAIVLATQFGCLDTDMAFTRSLGQPGGASPKLFSYTLPSTAIGEIAIRYGIKGPNTCICPGPDTTCEALWEGAELIHAGECRSCLCVAADAVSHQSASTGGGVPLARAFAIILDSDEEAGSVALVGTNVPPASDADLLKFLGNERQRDILLAAPQTIGSKRAFVLTKS